MGRKKLDEADFKKVFSLRVEGGISERFLKGYGNKARLILRNFIHEKVKQLESFD